jgi:hypothetical protein
MEKICLFLMIVNLPFLTVTHLMGCEAFIKSFQHPDIYQCLKTSEATRDSIPKGYLLLETPTDQPFIIKHGDVILYRSEKGNVKCELVSSIIFRQGVKIYYTTTPYKDDIMGPIYENQILGKVTKTIDDNIWNTFCLQIWDFSIKSLNAYTLLGKM